MKPVPTGMESSFYVFNRDRGGFVIISAESCAGDVLAYSPDGCFNPEDISPAQKYWLDNLASHVKNAPRTGIQKERTYTKAGTELVLNTAKWNQKSPHNNLCPEYAPAGCVPIAMAIALRYMKWPDCGVGSLEPYSYKDIHEKSHSIDGVELGYAYDWDNMPLSGVTKENASPVALLIRDCGLLVQAKYNYTDDGTAANPADILPALKQHMKCDASGSFRYAQYSSSEEWLDALFNEIDSDRPVIYSGADDTGTGHSFIVDGYDSEGRFHINWGWGGEGDGFFTFPEFGNYTALQRAVFGLRKDEGGRYTDCILVEGFKADTDDFKTGVSFNVNFTMYNIADSTFTGSVAVVRMGDDGTLKEPVSEEITSKNGIEPYTGLVFGNIPCCIMGDIAVGDLLTLFYKDRSGGWFQAQYDREDPGNAIIHISDTVHLDEATSFHYDRTTGKVTLITKPETVCKVSPEVSVTKENDSFILSGFTEGTYRVSLLCGTESFSFEIEL